MKKRKTTKRRIILVPGIILCIVLMFYMGIRMRYENIFCKNTFINGLDCSLLTVEEAMEIIKSQTEQYTLEIIFKDNEVEYISASEIGFTLDSLEEELTGIKEQQRKDLLLKGGEYNFDNFSYNEEKLTEVLSSKTQLQPDYMEEKTEIKYDFNFNSKLFEITEQNVYYLDSNLVFKEVSEAIENNQESVSVENLYELPQKHDTLLYIMELNNLLSSKVKYQLPGVKEYTLGATTLYSWLVQDEDGNYLKDDEIWNKHIEDFVTNELSEMANTVGNIREFTPTGKDETVLVEGGNYGYLLDIEAEMEMLKADLESQTTIKREPCYEKTEVSTENNGLGNSYIEIDITRQKVWVYVNGNLEVETDCVTGCVNKGYDTPTGICTLTYKTTDKVLRGQKLANGEYEYESHVNYWMPFNGGVGLHDAAWRHSFGGNIYISDGSHGCINLPFNSAKEIYEIINDKMPIIVYKSEEVPK